MKKMKFLIFYFCLALVFGGCKSMNNAKKDGMIGGGAGAAVGAIIGEIGRAHV